MHRSMQATVGILFILLFGWRTGARASRQRLLRQRHELWLGTRVLRL